MTKTYNISDEAFNIGKIALQAALYEVACFPAPGLVSPISNGAHKDMDYYTFIDSTVAINQYLILCAQSGFSQKSYKEIFKEIREIGVQAENSMFEATNGVNTHKGLLFLLGICCAAVGKTIYEQKSFDHIRKTIQNMAEGIVREELCNIKNKKIHDKNIKLTHGENLFLKYGIEGIRGNVEKGLPVIFDFSLDFYKNACELNNNNRLVHTLIGIMQFCEDSNIIYRHSIDVLKEVQNKAKYIISIGSIRIEAGKEAISQMNEEFIQRKISPGGSADLLAVTVFLYNIEGQLFIDQK